ncbi:fructose-bisphosphatase class III [Enterococcus rivorum]|uniref:Fructose-1,6-bisphosphatase class 3 n=1 Tax=Enterococcus rivorum TaxID=762845 RepID=A0A1E5KTV1_9ENTE|nr:fructose-bisphosphatase class III [Enterococcus rivorum]MBP2098112.1 fructose-1,6-bisphosphatase-3 [Enterococcus rivorum]OEH81049.1 fructose 1,6-bisphosphatase [Enterococcus rivorum]
MKKSKTNEMISEIINLEAILNLPKGTEHFVSDLHGEFEAFDHILRNGSGSIRDKVMTIFAKKLSQTEINELCFLIYYPEEKIALLQKKQSLSEEWWFNKIEYLITLVRFSSSKYTRSKVRKALPETYAYILEELIYQYDETTNKKAYYAQIIEKIIDLGQAERFVTDLAYLIQRFVIDHLHVIGDIYDRGPHPEKIMDKLKEYHSLDIQLGNHDIIWLGAFSGSKACLANVIRICSRYGNLNILEEAYGIDLSKLREFSQKKYQHNLHFKPKRNPYRNLSTKELVDSMKIQQAIAVIQEKLEAQIILRRPEFQMEHRLCLDKINNLNTIVLQGVSYPLINECFQTVDWAAPFQLTEEETEIMNDLLSAFQQSKKLKDHMTFLMENGSLYLTYNQNLLIHGCVPLNKDGSFKKLTFNGQSYDGKALIDFFEKNLRISFASPEITDDFSTDMIWYLWCGDGSSLFGKHAMKTFERYFLEDKETHLEIKNPYYELRNEPEICNAILKEFGLPAEGSHIINGHTPIKLVNGESPIKSSGKMLVIDGGFSKSYQEVTGIGGYTLLYNSFGMQLAAHKPFSGKQEAILTNSDISTTRQVVDRQVKRLKVKDTNIGQTLASDAQYLHQELRKNNMNEVETTVFRVEK